MPKFGHKESWPEEWSIVRQKTYPALPTVQLLEPEIQGVFSRTLAGRRSSVDFSGAPLTLRALSGLLILSFGDLARDGEPHVHSFKKPFPSAGARYPLEVYVMVAHAEGLAAGMYHFNPQSHTLTFLKELTPQMKEKVLASVGYEWAMNVSVFVFITSVFSRMVDKYGERGYRLALLEAGHAGQNLCLAATEAGVKCCPLALADETPVNECLGVDGLSESVVHSFAVGL